MQAVNQKTNIFIAFWRTGRLFVHFILGFLRVIIFYRNYDDAKKVRVVQLWSQKFLKILGIRLCVQGEPLNKQAMRNTLLAANHISWLDIIVIFTVMMPRFVSKAEVGEWPLVGRLLKAGNTILINRESKRNIVQVNRMLSNELLKGGCIAFFPEGTTSEGYCVQPFKASLFEPVCQSHGHVLPVTIRYLDQQGNVSTRPSFVGKITLLRSAWNLLTSHKLTVSVTLGERINSSDYAGRYELAKAVHQVVAANFEKSNELV